MLVWDHIRELLIYPDWDVCTLRETQEVFQRHWGVGSFNGIKFPDPQFLYYSFLINKVICLGIHQWFCFPTSPFRFLFSYLTKENLTLLIRKKLKELCEITINKLLTICIYLFMWIRFLSAYVYLNKIGIVLRLYSVLFYVKEFLFMDP